MREASMVDHERGRGTRHRRCIGMGTNIHNSRGWLLRRKGCLLHNAVGVLRQVTLRPLDRVQTRAPSAILWEAPFRLAVSVSSIGCLFYISYAFPAQLSDASIPQERRP